MAKGGVGHTFALFLDGTWHGHGPNVAVVVIVVIVLGWLYCRDVGNIRTRTLPENSRVLLIVG